jgi:hypothetical protein
MTVNIFVYDCCQGNPRLNKNVQAIREAAGSNLALTIRETPFYKSNSGISGAEDLLLNTFGYDAVIIHADATHSQDAIAAAELALEMNGLPKNRLIVLTADNSHPSEGAQYVQAHGGNGYVSMSDAMQIIGVLKKFDH